MKKEHTRFITGLLSNPKLSLAQRDKVVELALRDLGKSGSDERIMKELQLIKEKLGIKISANLKKNGKIETGGKDNWTISLTDQQREGWGENVFTNLPEMDEETQRILEEVKGGVDKQKTNISAINRNKKPSQNSTGETAILDNQKREKLTKVPPSAEVSENLSLSYYFPSGLYKYLFEYNQDPVLRSTCHEIDSNELAVINKYCGTETYQFEKHLETILEAFETHENKNFAPTRVKALIRGYLTGKDFNGNYLKSGWSSDRISFSWSSLDLKNWCKKNENYPPCPDPGLIESQEMIGFEFTEAIKSKNFNKYFKTFNDLVIHFKHLFHIRQDNSLKNILLFQNKIKNWNEKIDFEINHSEFPTNIELFTDVDKLIQAYNIIIALIFERQIEEKPQVKLSFCQTDGGVEFSIHHLNTVYNKSLIDTLERPLGRTYSGLVENQLNGMCNFYLCADFGQQQFARVNIWDGKSRDAVTIDVFKGVEHILEFRKK